MIFVITVIIIGTVLWCWRDLKRTQAEQVAECAATTESNELTQTEVEVPSYVTVFQEYRESDPWVAMLVMRNALTRFKDSLELFITYMDYLFLMAAQTDGLEYLEEARSVMLQYGEHAAIKDFPKIVSYRERIYQLEQTFYAKSLELLQQGNTEILLQLQHYLGQLREVDTEKAFQTVLQSVAHIEEDLDLDTLTPEQSGLYANLKREFVETAELLSSSLEHERHKT